MPKEKPKQTTLDEKFIVNLHGKDFCIYEGVLNLAHKKKLKRLEVKLLQYPTEENNHEAICQAIAETESGAIFSDIGDASPRNVNSKIAPHIIRMASTRSKNRCLKDLVGIGISEIEGLSDFNDVMDAGKGKNNLVDIKKKTKTKTKKTKPVATTNQYPISGAQRRAISSIAKKGNMSEEEINKLVEGNFGTTVENLSLSQGSSLIKMLQKSA